MIAGATGLTPVLQVLDVRTVNSGSTSGSGDRHKCVARAHLALKPEKRLQAVYTLHHRCTQNHVVRRRAQYSGNGHVGFEPRECNSLSRWNPCFPSARGI